MSLSQAPSRCSQHDSLKRRLSDSRRTERRSRNQGTFILIELCVCVSGLWACVSLASLQTSDHVINDAASRKPAKCGGGGRVAVLINLSFEVLKAKSVARKWNVRSVWEI